MTAEIQTAEQARHSAMIRLALDGDTSKLTPQQKVAHYVQVCELLGVNPLTHPLSYIRFKDGREQLYATKELAAQLRKRDHVSITVRVDVDADNGIITAWADARIPSILHGGYRADQDVSIRRFSATGDPKNGIYTYEQAYVRAVTGAKRRVTLSICGLGAIIEGESAELEAEDVTVIEVSNPELMDMLDKIDEEE